LGEAPPPPDPARLVRILRALAPADAAWLTEMLEPGWKARQRRLDQRDALIRNELNGVAGGALTVRAAALERRMRRLAVADLAARQVVALNDGRALSWQHLARIARAGRNPVCKNSAGAAQEEAPAFRDEPFGKRPETAEQADRGQAGRALEEAKK
jgi:hypothetical protein